MFADDLFLFGSASTHTIQAFEDCIDTYNSWSGQSINQKKSSLHFSRNISLDSVNIVKNSFEFRVSPPNSKYLGLPLLSGVEKKKFLRNL